MNGREEDGERLRQMVSRWRRCLLVFAAALGLVWGLGLDQMKSVSGWSTALLLVGAACACWVLWRTHCPGPPWWLCTLAFLAMASDDYFFGAHDDVRRQIGRIAKGSVGRVGALLVAAVLLIAGAILFARWFVIRLPRRAALQASAGFAIAIFGAGVVDVLGGRIAVWAGPNSDWHRLNVIVEECLELVGVALVFLALVELLVTTRALNMATTLTAHTDPTEDVASHRHRRRGPP